MFFNSLRWISCSRVPVYLFVCLFSSWFVVGCFCFVWLGATPYDTLSFLVLVLFSTCRDDDGAGAGDGNGDGMWRLVAVLIVLYSHASRSMAYLPYLPILYTYIYTYTYTSTIMASALKCSFCSVGIKPRS